jgi:UDP-N-acetyl-D-mannosaminuronic acid transferase (WecB/TagA/CpsF family)
MTLDQTDYLQALQAAISEFTITHCTKLNKNKNRYLTGVTKVILLKSYYTIMYRYFATTFTSDAGFFTTTEAEEVMQKINDILKSNYWVTL